jgi:hypothetical protein
MLNVDYGKPPEQTYDSTFDSSIFFDPKDMSYKKFQELLDDIVKTAENSGVMGGNPLTYEILKFESGDKHGFVASFSNNIAARYVGFMLEDRGYEAEMTQKLIIPPTQGIGHEKTLRSVEEALKEAQDAGLGKKGASVHAKYIMRKSSDINIMVTGNSRANPLIDHAAIKLGLLQ